MSNSNVVESEVVLFLLIDRVSAATLNARVQHGDAITQARVFARTDSGQEITTRVRRSVLTGKSPVYTQCTKYLLPGNDMSQGQCVEIESEINEEQFKAAIPFMDTVSVKVRHSIRHNLRIHGPVLEIDHMVPAGGKQGGEFIKVDIEGGQKVHIPAYLKVLENNGIRIVRNLTEEGIKEGKNIGGKLMSGPDYNHAAK